MIRPLEYRVLVQPEKIEETDPVYARAKAAGLDIAKQTSEREQMAQVKATILALGGNAFEDWGDERLPKVGDTVLIAKYSGFMVPGDEDESERPRIINDKDVAALIE